MTLMAGTKLGQYENLAPLALARWARSIDRDTRLHVVLWNITPQVENGRVHSNNPSALRASR